MLSAGSEHEAVHRGQSLPATQAQLLVEIGSPPSAVVNSLELPFRERRGSRQPIPDLSDVAIKSAGEILL